MMSDPPTGTLTFLFTDIEGSTRLAQEHGAAWAALNARHLAILRAAVEAHGGHLFKTIGDAIQAAFASASAGLLAAVEAQHRLTAEVPFKVRMGLNTGFAIARDGEYDGYVTLTRAQRVMSVGHGGQILVSQTTAELAREELPAGHALRDLGEQRLKGLFNPERVFQAEAPGLPRDFPPLASSKAIPHNLPAQLTSFVGREKEIGEVVRQLAAARLLTLTGSGGTGKTRLSLRVAEEALDQFADGVWFVELAPLADPALVPRTVASVLGIFEQPGRPALSSVTDFARDKQLLVVMDNCEHLLEACATLADAVLRAAPRVKVLASSREALGIAGEHAYRVPSLAGPNPRELPPLAEVEQFAAVRLFVERAQAVKTEFTLNAANASAIAQICQRLDGIPLAIELAAARVKVLAPEQIASRLDDRFRLLTGGSRTALPRQQTLRSAIDWSHSLLSEQERILLRRLAVFAGGWFLEAAENVCGENGIEAQDVLDLLSRLVEKSLVVENEWRGVARYRLLETTRQYARDKLLESGEGEQVRGRHLKHFARQAANFYRDMQRSDNVSLLAKADIELDNYRVALDWSAESREILTGLQIASDLHLVWFREHRIEGVQVLSGLLSQPEAAQRTVARARGLAAHGLLRGYVVENQADALQTLDEALAIGREVGDEEATAFALGYLGRVESDVGGHDDAAKAHLSEAVEKLRYLGIAFWAGYFEARIGDIALSHDDLETARTAYEESVRTLRPMGVTMPLPFSLRRLGQLALRSGDSQHAAEFALESLEMNHRLLDVSGVAACLAALAAVRLVQGKWLLAARLCGAAGALIEGMSMRMMRKDEQMFDQTVAELRTVLPAAEFDAAWAGGRALTLDQAVALALESADA